MDDMWGRVFQFQGKFLPLFKFDILFIVGIWHSFLFFWNITVDGIILIMRFLGTSLNFVPELSASLPLLLSQPCPGL